MIPEQPGSVAPTLFFDYVDPESYLFDLIVRELEEEWSIEVVRHPLELAPPDRPLLDPTGTEWGARMERVEGHGAILRRRGRESTAGEIVLRRPDGFVPRSRKAHELGLVAREAGRFRGVHEGIFEAFFREGADVGRIDRLVEIGVRAGLDPTAAKVALDVDRMTSRVAALRAEAERRGVARVPTLVTARARLQGVPSVDEIREVLDPSR